MNLTPPDASKRPPVFALLYEDFESGSRAREFANRYSRGSHDETVWHMELLDEPQAALQAARVAADADFVIISFSGHGNIPSSLKQWLGFWLGSLSRSTAVLVAMFDPVLAHAGFIHSMCDYLETVSKLAGATFQTGEMRKFPAFERVPSILGDCSLVSQA